MTDTESSKLTSDGSNSWQQQNFQSADDKSELIGHEVLETTDVRIFFVFFKMLRCGPKKMTVNQNYAFIKNSTIFTQSLWNSVKIRYSWVTYFDRAS